ncbi:MAG: SIMPL domain-containing protein [Treponema sp.]|jgi:uncharacterized protein YggE|nr:SIMPL domain-containing protein [Treponema sp.]
MKLFKFITFTILLMIVSACVSTPIADNKVITVYGIGRTSYNPDIINIRISIKNTNDSLLLAAGRTKETMVELLFHCGKFNISDEDIRGTKVITTKHNVYNSETNRSDIVRYESIKEIHISIKDLSIFEEFSEEILHLTGLAIEGYFFTHSNIAQYETDANLLAFDDARSKAEKMAEHSGFRLGNILEVSYSKNQDPNIDEFDIHQGFYWSSVGVSALPGIITLSQWIQVKYRIE